MNWYKATYNENMIRFQAKNVQEAGMYCYQHFFPETLDDDLPDKMDQVEIEQITSPEQEAYDAAQVDQAIEDGFHSHGDRR